MELGSRQSEMWRISLVRVSTSDCWLNKGNSVPYHQQGVGEEGGGGGELQEWKETENPNLHILHKIISDFFFLP